MLTRKGLFHEKKIVEKKQKQKRDKQSMVSSSNTAHQPHAVMVEPTTATLTQLTVFGAIGENYLCEQQPIKE